MHTQLYQFTLFATMVNGNFIKKRENYASKFLSTVDWLMAGPSTVVFTTTVDWLKGYF